MSRLVRIKFSEGSNPSSSTMNDDIDTLGGICTRCGYDKYYGALDCHHKDPSKKMFNLCGNGATQKWSIIEKELDKCVLLCATCHREVEAGIE